MKRISVDSLVIEATRRCNACCPHCLRGDSQNKDIPFKFIDTVFSKVEHVNFLTISGGEPSLVPEIINYIVESAIKHKVEVCGFYLTTNALQVSNTFFLSLVNTWLGLGSSIDREMFIVNYSNDDYHIPPPEKNLRKLKALSFVSPKYNDTTKHYTKNVIWEGRAKKEYFYDGRKNYKDKIEIDDGVVTNILYLNCNGEIINGCDWSYKNQWRHKICDVEGLSLSTIKPFVKKQKEDRQ